MNQDSFTNPDIYSPLEENKKDSIIEPEMSFGAGSDSDFKRIPDKPPEQKSIIAFQPAGSQIKKELHFEFTAWMRFQIITYHLSEPVLVASLIGTSLNMPQLETLITVILCLVIYMPLLLTGVESRVKIKIVMSIILLALTFLYLIFKLVIYFKQYDYFVQNPDFTKFLGIFFGNWVMTFVLDTVLILLTSLLIWSQVSQLNQVRQVALIGENRVQFQMAMKYLHPLFGDNFFVFYTISYFLFLFDTFFYQTFVQLAILVLQLIQMYLWSIKISIPIVLRKIFLRIMQISTFIMLSLAFTISMPYIFDGFEADPQNAKVLELIGYIQLNPSYKGWIWRSHIIILSAAIVLSEIFFVADRIYTRQKSKRHQTTQAPTTLLKRRLLIMMDEAKRARLEEKISWQHQIRQIWLILRQPLTLWLARVTLFIWAYLYHDYQSLLILVWIMHSTFFVKSTLFSKITAYFYLPMFNLLWLWYFTINIYGLLDWQKFQSNTTWYAYGFYQLKFAPLQFGFMCLNISLLSVYVRFQFEKKDHGLQTQQIIQDLNNQRSTLWQMFYLIVVYLEYPLFLALVLSGLSKMDFYHVSLLFIFVAYTLFPRFFHKNSILLLLYADLFILMKYVWTLITKSPQNPSSWLTIIGISSDYDPNSTTEYFRYAPKFDQWLLVILTFCLYRRSNLIGTNWDLVQQKELECIKELYYKFPWMKRLFTTVDIVINHCIIIFTFIFFLILLLLLRRSFLNLISLILMLIIICSYMSKGIQRLNFYWNTLTFYQAFVLLSILAYQFVYQSGISDQSWFQKYQQSIDVRTQAISYWIGYYKFENPLWYHFLPYVILFSFAVTIRHRFRIKQQLQSLVINLPEEQKQNEMLYSSRSNLNEDGQVSSKSSLVSAPYRASLSRQQAEEKISLYFVELTENYYNMLYQIQYPVMKIKIAWPVLTYVSRYFNFLLNIVIFSIALYFQIALIWLIFLVIYLLQAWTVSTIHQKYSTQQFDDFKPQNLPMSPTQASTVSQDKLKKPSLRITDQETMQEFANFRINVHKTSIETRHIFWVSQFGILIISIFFAYLSDFVTTAIQIQGTSIYLINSETIRDKVLFLYFWCGFYRQTSFQQQQLTDQTALIKIYWPFFVLILLLIFEKLSQQWLLDKFGTNEELIDKWSKLEQRYLQMLADEVKASQEEELQLSQRSRKNNIRKSTRPVRPDIIQEEEKEVSTPSHKRTSVNQSVISEDQILEIQRGQSFDVQEPLNFLTTVASQQIYNDLKPLLTIKSKVSLFKALKIGFEQLIVLLLWFSCIYKESILSFVIFGVLAYTTYVKTPDSSLLLVRYTVVFLLVIEYSLFLSNLTSYNSPTLFPSTFTQINVNGTSEAAPYPNAENYYFYIPWYFSTRLATKDNPPQINVNLYTYFSIPVSSDQQNGMWFDFIITVLVVFYLDNCNFFVLQQKIKIINSNQCNADLQRYAEVMKYYNKSPKEVKKELSVMMLQNRIVEYWAKWLYQDFILVMITVVLVISIFGRTLLSYGYFLFCMILISQSRKFFIVSNSHKTQKKILKYYLLPYLLLDIFLQLIYQPPIPIFNDTKNYAYVIGFQTFWNSTPSILTLGQNVTVNTTLLNTLTPVYLKGVAYFCIMIQLAIIESRGFKNFKKKFSSETMKNMNLIGRGIAYRFNNFKAKKILKEAKSFSDLQQMLYDVKVLIERRNKLFQEKSDYLRQKTNLKPSGELPLIEEEKAQKKKAEVDFRKQFESDYKLQFEERLKQLPIPFKLYLWIRRNLVHDILFKYSQNHLVEIVQDFQNGRTCQISNLEWGISYQVKKQLLQKLMDNIEQKENEQKKSDDLSMMKDSEFIEEDMNIQLEKSDFMDFKRKINLTLQPKPWRKIDLETFDSWKTLAFAYVNLMYRIVASYTEWICYIFMLVATYSNGGLLYMVYPAIIFGYALLEEYKPGARFWYIIIFYTQFIIFLQFTVQLNLWQFEGQAQTESFYQWTLKINLGLVYIEDFTFGKCFAKFTPEILVLISVLVHIQNETLQGVFDKPPHIFEQFEDGLRRYRLQINKNDNDHVNQLAEMFQVESITKQDLEYQELLRQMLRVRSRSFDQKEFSEDQRANLNCPLIRSQQLDFQNFELKSNVSMDAKFEIRTKKQLSTLQKLQQDIKLFWDNSFFSRLFPALKQQKPGQDFYVPIMVVSVIIVFYVILFYTQMSGQKTTIADQYNSNQFQSGMVITVLVMIVIMVVDRIFYGSHAQLQQRDFEIVKHKLEVKKQLQAKNNAVNRTKSLNQTLDQFSAMDQTVDKDSISQSELDSDEEEAVKFKAYEEALTPVYRQRSWKRIVKVYYFWAVLILVHWFIFFEMPNQQKYCTEVVQTQKAFCNKFSKNSALIIFYTLFVIYFILSAFQLQKGMPEFRKGGFMIDKYDPLSKNIFNIWYYIPFLFELRSIIDWTFSTTALDIFQWLKLAQIQANLYYAKCQNKVYREKELGESIPIVFKATIGCGLILLILTLIAGPMLLFSSLNPISSSNNVTKAALQFYLTIDDNLQQTTYNSVLFQTQQVTNLQNLTQSEFDNLGFNNFSTTTALFYPDQIQALQFAPNSDSVWTVSGPTRQALLLALQEVQNNNPNITVTANLRTTLVRPSGDAEYLQQLLLTNATQPAIIQSMINQINCQGTSPIITSYPTDTVVITVKTTQSAAQPLQDTYTSGFNLYYSCNNTNPAENYWGLSQVFPSNSNIQEYDIVFPDNIGNGFGYFIFSQFILPNALASYSSSVLVFYATIVYVVASSLRSGIVPYSYQIFITDAPLTEDILSICTSIHIYRMQRNLEQQVIVCNFQGRRIVFHSNRYYEVTRNDKRAQQKFFKEAKIILVINLLMKVKDQIIQILNLDHPVVNRLEMKTKALEQFLMIDLKQQRDQKFFQRRIQQDAKRYLKSYKPQVVEDQDVISTLFANDVVAYPESTYNDASVRSLKTQADLIVRSLQLRRTQNVSTVTKTNDFNFYNNTSIRKQNRSVLNLQQHNQHQHSLSVDFNQRQNSCPNHFQLSEKSKRNTQRTSLDKIVRLNQEREKNRIQKMMQTYQLLQQKKQKEQNIMQSLKIEQILSYRKFRQRKQIY